MSWKTEVHPELVKRVEKMFDLAEREGFELRVVSAFRSHAEQDKLFRKRPKVTNARGGQSWHNFGLACDIAPVIDGKVSWDEKKFDWSLIGKWAKATGLEWGGAWRTFKDRPHVQLISGFKNTAAANKIYSNAGNKLSAVWQYVTEHTEPLKVAKPKAEKVNDLAKVQELIALPETVASGAGIAAESLQENISETIGDAMDSGTSQIEGLQNKAQGAVNDVVVQVEQAKPELDLSGGGFLQTAKEKVEWFKAKFLAVPSALGVGFLGVYNWITGAPIYLILGLFAVAAVIGVSYIILYMWLKNSREKREAEKVKAENDLKMQRERQAHELTLKQMESAMRPDYNTVKVVPQPVQNSDSAP